MRAGAARNGMRELGLVHIRGRPARRCEDRASRRPDRGHRRPHRRARARARGGGIRCSSSRTVSALVGGIGTERSPSAGARTRPEGRCPTRWQAPRKRSARRLAAPSIGRKPARRANGRSGCDWSRHEHTRRSPRIALRSTFAASASRPRFARSTAVFAVAASVGGAPRRRRTGFFQYEPRLVSAVDHLPGGLVLLALVAAADRRVIPRMRAGRSRADRGIVARLPRPPRLASRASTTGARSGSRATTYTKPACPSSAVLGP
jgi:hypothetical protein